MALLPQCTAIVGLIPTTRPRAEGGAGCPSIPPQKSPSLKMNNDTARVDLIQGVISRERKNIMAKFYIKSENLPALLTEVYSRDPNSYAMHGGFTQEHMAGKVCITCEDRTDALILALKFI
jgi:hypothetical protein